jgi:nucleoid DNA-binding protein
MKLKELNEAIAAACNVRANVVSQVQNETFRALRAAIDKGEKVVVPEFGIFLIKDVPGEEGAPGKKVMRFKARSGDKSGKAKKEKREKRKGKTAGAEGKGAAAGSDDDGGED